MAKQLNVNLAFTADTTKVKSQLRDLQNQLTLLINNTNKNSGMLGFSEDIQKASVAAATLKNQLTEAINVNTGALDLGKFSQSLKQSGMSIEQYKTALISLGPEGSKAFAQLAQSIITAEVPLRRSNAILQEFGTTLKNTARWQLSSGILHGFMGTIQHAYGYAQDLNESLNNIRIVTGQNTEQMAKFANEANKAAQALSTTTTEYTNASLIYYQQGLSDDEVKKRTDVTVKMANVTRESAEEVSQQLTAVWNNFDNGTKSLEYYADVMTALGAATASSSAEIAEGLEKFAAVADTVGLSYEYATAALATVTATTRQSADVVGNAFKTLFARLEGLSLGETLDDGTDLNKYSQALYAVGINIKDTNGDMKEMDQILDELGDKWNTLAKDEQIALAQTVAGVRQYTQLIALMDNWDFFEQNVKIAEDASGTLQEQADIYAESWEAARDRVKAASEEIYRQLLNDKFFIGLNNVLAETLKLTSGVIDGLGGVKGVLLLIGTFMMNSFKPQIIKGLEDVRYNLLMMTDAGRKAIFALREETNKQLSNMFTDEGSIFSSNIGENYASQAEVQQILLDNADKMTEKQQAIAQILLDQHNTLVKEAVAQGELAEAAQQEADAATKKTIRSMRGAVNKSAEENNFPGNTRIATPNGIRNIEKYKKELQEQINLISKQSQEAAAFRTIVDKTFSTAGKDASYYTEQLELLEKTQGDLAVIVGQEGVEAFNRFKETLSQTDVTSEQIDEALARLQDDITRLEQLGQPTELLEKHLSALGIDLTVLKEKADAAGVSVGEMALKTLKAKKSAATFEDSLKKIPNTVNTAMTSLVNLGQQLMTVSMAISSITGLIETWNNEDLSGGEKLLQTMTTLGMVIPMVTRAINQEKLSAAMAAIATKLFGASATSAAVETTALGSAILFVETTLVPLLVITLAVAAAMAALVAIGWVVVRVFEEIKANSPEGKLDAAEKSAKELGNAFDELKSKADDLNSSFNQYDNAIETLENCTRGTQEWSDALAEVNNQVLEILDKYPELLAYVDRDEKGQLYFKEDDIQNILDQANKNAQVAQYANLQANLEAQRQSTIAGSDFNKVQEFLNSADNYLNEDSYKYLRENIYELGDLTDKEFKEKLKQLGINEEVSESLLEYKDSIKKVSLELDNNIEAQKNLGNLIVSENLDVAKYGEEIITILGNTYTEILDEKANEYEEQIKQLKENSSELDDLWIKYQKATGTNYDLASNAVRGAGSERTVAYLVDGEVKEINAKSMASTLAAADALEQLGIEADKVSNIFSILDKNTGESVSSGIKNWITSGNFNEMTSQEFEALRTEWGEVGSTEEYLKSLFGVSTTEELSEIAYSLGHENAEEMIDAFNKSMANYDKAVTDVKNRMYETTKKAFEELEESKLFDQASNNIQISIANLLDDAFKNAGKEGVEGIKDIISNLQPDELDEFITATEGINWETSSVDDFRAALKEAGVVTNNLTDEQLANFISAMKSTPGIITDATESFKALHDVIDDLSNGATISEEQYKALGGDIYESFFLKMADGTYKLTTDAQSFYDIVNKQSIEAFESNIDKITSLQQYSFEDLNKNTASFDWNTFSTKYDSNKVSSQLDFLSFVGGYEDQITKWNDVLNNGDSLLSAKTLSEIADAVAQNSDQWDYLDQVLKDNQEQLASTAEDLGELHEMLDQNRISEEAFTKAALAMDAATDTQNLDTEELKDYTKYLQEASHNMEGFNDEMSKDEARTVAKGILKMNDAIETLSDNWENWVDILQSSSKSSEEYVEAISGARKAVSELLDISEEYVNSDFILEHLEEIGQAAEGDAEAIDNLKKELSENIIVNIITDNKLDNIKDSLLSDFYELQASIPNIEIGATLDDGEFLNKAQKLIEDCNMTVDQANAMFDSLGFEANFATEEKLVHQRVPRYITKTEIIEEDEDKGTRTTSTSTYQDGFDEFDGVMDVPAMSTNGKTPIINSITKKATGSANNFSSTNKGGPKSSSSSSSAKSPDKKDYLEDKVDRYYDINNAISEVNQELEKQEQLEKQLSSLESHYAGKTLIENLKKQNDLIKNKNGLLEKQFANYEKIYDLQAQELADLKATIGGSWEGNILQNYSELFQANLDKYNAAIDVYNAMSAEQQEESGKQMIEDAKEAYDTYKDSLERYQDLYYNEMYDTENKLAELRQTQLENQLKIIENNLKGWEVEIELKLNKTELERDLNDFFKEVEQDFRKIYEDLTIDSAFDTKNFNTFLEDVETRMSQIRDVESEIEKMNRSKDANGVVQITDDMMFGSIEEAQEKLKDLQKELTNTGKELTQMYEQVWDNYIKGLDQAKDNFEDINKELDNITSELEYEKELIELIYGDKAYDLMNKYYETQQKNLETQISSTREQALFWEDQFNKAYQMNREKHNVDLDDMSTWTEDMRKAYNNMIDSQKKLNDLVIEGIKNLKDEYLNNVAKTLSDMDQALFGMSFDDLKEDWDFIQKKADEYLDDVEGAYQIQTLANKIDTSIAETTSLKAQQKLAALREDEINFLREKKNLTEDDIKIAEARYQIALKEIALEDAQNNKTSMKLTRDTSGNWTYQYVADEEDVAAKQQDLLDSYNELYKLADDAYAHAMELAMNMYEEYKSRLQEVAEDTTLTEEEKYLKMQELQELYLPEIMAATENAGLYEQETLMAAAAVFAEVCEQDAEAYYSLTDLQKTLVDEVRDQHLEDYEEIRAAILENYDEIGEKARDTFEETNLNSQTAAADIIGQWNTNEGTDSVKGAMEDAFDNIIKYTQNFETELYRLEQVSGKTIMSPGGVVDDINNIGVKVDEVANKTTQMASVASANLDNLRDFVNEVENAWDGVIKSITKAIDKLQEFLRYQGAAANASSVNVNANKYSNLIDNIKDSANDNSNKFNSDRSSSKNSIMPDSDEEVSDSGRFVLEHYGTYEDLMGIWDTYTGNWIEIGKDLDKDDLDRLDKEKNMNTLYALAGITGLATGGYTGDWDSQTGKLAVLHEKELVLNATDTENILGTVKAVRDLAGLNESIGSTIANSIGNLIATALNIRSGNVNTNTSNNTSNVFNITAEFPNADDVQTIKDAILSLPNIASQYVYEG